MIKTISLAVLLFLVGFGVAKAGCDDPQTQTEMNICAGKEFNSSDAQLNTLYNKKIKTLNKTHKTVLKKAQRAWITYRDLACESYGLNAEGGTMQSMLVSNCLTEITRQRIKMLEDQFQTY
jgi:uncharacterized protein YecT (DUF1311 family)